MASRDFYERWKRIIGVSDKELNEVKKLVENFLIEIGNKIKTKKEIYL